MLDEHYPYFAQTKVSDCIVLFYKRNRAIVLDPGISNFQRGQNLRAKEKDFCRLRSLGNYIYWNGNPFGIHDLLSTRVTYNTRNRVEKGYRPIGRLDTTRPPQGGSGVSTKGN
jgi:hypothetical protein